MFNLFKKKEYAEVEFYFFKNSLGRWVTDEICCSKTGARFYLTNSTLYGKYYDRITPYSSDWPIDKGRKFTLRVCLEPYVRCGILYSLVHKKDIKFLNSMVQELELENSGLGLKGFLKALGVKK